MAESAESARRDAGPGLGRLRRLIWLPLLAIFSPAAGAEYAAGWGPEIGALVAVEAFDQDGQMRTLENLAGERGLLLFLNRSADW